mmetsp:Transcript_52249/g.52642  ORF Transcript_52249/g.52642 Transcript_52249/m.52642 type:complete len:107 (-) Transcript_52249:532-852(-)
MINGADLEPILVPPYQTGLLPPIAGGSPAHDAGLHKDAATAVGVGSVLGIDRGEGDAILIILPQMEMSREPRLDAAMLSHQFDEFAALLIVGMVEPAASVHHVILL